MTWNYRIVHRRIPLPTSLQRPDGDGYADSYAIHEAYYNEKRGKRKCYAVTDNPVAAIGDTPEEVIGTLELMLKDAKRAPILEYDKVGKS